MPGPHNDLAARIAEQAAVLHTDPPVRAQLVAGLVDLAERHRDAIAARTVPPLTAGSCYLITYGDSFVRPGEAPLATLRTIRRPVAAGSAWLDAQSVATSHVSSTASP